METEVAIVTWFKGLKHYAIHTVWAFSFAKKTLVCVPANDSGRRECGLFRFQKRPQAWTGIRR